MLDLYKLSSTLDELSRALDEASRTLGFEAQPARYITGEFNIKLHDGNALYSDEAHLWCADCAHSLLRKVQLLEGPDAEVRKIWTADPSGGEDTHAHCMGCGETLDHRLNDTGIACEVEHYENAPSAAVNAQQLFCLARLADAAVYSSEFAEDVAQIARDHLALYAAGAIQAPFTIPDGSTVS